MDDNQTPVSGREGYAEEHNRVSVGLGELAQSNGLVGAVLITFAPGRVGTCACGTEHMIPYMEALALKILQQIDNGAYDPNDLVKPS